MARHREHQVRSGRGVGIRSRLVGLLAVPLVGLLVLTGIGLADGASRSRDASALEDRTALALAGYRLIDALQVERAALIDGRGTTEQMRDTVAASAAELTRRADVVGGDLQAATAAVQRRVLGVQMIALRQLGGQVALNTYSATIAELLELAGRSIDPAGALDGAPAATVDYLARANEATAQERDLLVVVGTGGDVDAGTFQDIMRLASEQTAYSSLAASTAIPVVAVQIERVGLAMEAADALRREAFGDVAGPGPALDEWTAGLTERAEDLARFRDAATVGALGAVDELARSSRAQFIVAAFAIVAIVLVSALLLRWAARSIARPLQDLAVQAEDVANSRLPEAVHELRSEGSAQRRLPALRAAGATEVREVTEAFNQVQDAALRLAGQQAALRVNQSEALTNLGRRNQTLLGRQLDFISSLETRETDPVFLDHLFKLDHLASRMRRNAESLLILAGSETPRRRRTPAPIVEVVRAAMSEVEDFERVRIGHLLDATVAGPVVIDLVHLLAELIENALGFSPPETTVELDGRALAQGGYQLAVIDHGVGMTDVELSAANQRMRGSDELDGMPTRYLGQYVVAKLAGKVGVMVRLQVSAGGRGVTALVNLPTSAMFGTPERSAVTAPMPGSRAAREQGPAPFAPGAGVLGAATSDPVVAVSRPEPVEVESVEVVEPEVVDPAEVIAPVGLVQPPAEPEPSRVVVASTEVDDPWSAFRSDSTEPSIPPPPAVDPPVQSGWVPTAGPVSFPGEGRAGGLSRRVPGASLAGRSEVGVQGPLPQDRSADGVRSMLSSFQAGRSRGRSAPVPEPGHDHGGDVVAEPREDQLIADLQDGRSSQ